MSPMNMTGNQLKAFIDEFGLGDTVVTGIVHIGKGGGNPEDIFELPKAFHFQVNQQDDVFYAHKVDNHYQVAIQGLTTKWTVEEVESQIQSGEWEIVIRF